MHSIGIFSALVAMFMVLPAPSIEESFIEETFKPESLQQVVRDVGYFLRNHKFNEYDRRSKDKEQKLFAEFPRPPLYRLHPEVKKFCGDGKFRGCLQYLHGISQTLSLRRAEDSATLVNDGGWTRPHNDTLIDQAEKSCQQLKEQDEQWTEPGAIFQGPLERFQWRVSASYYMCWFSMLQRPALAHFGEACDNFASCLDPKFGAHNHDPRANDFQPYACARYSFCPDTCCGQRHVHSMEECISSPLNPCHMAKRQHKPITSPSELTTIPEEQTEESSTDVTSQASPTDSPPAARSRVAKSPTNTWVAPTCQLPSERNIELRALQLNHWNHSCPCPDEGYEWDSRFSTCVDIDECSHDITLADEATKPCGGPQVAACFNLPGHAGCVCRWGFKRLGSKGECVPDLDLASTLATFHTPT